MILQIAPELAALLQAEAQRTGTTAEDLALDILRQRVTPPVSLSEPIDDWERGLHAIARDCGISLSDEDLSRETMYD